MKTPFPHLDKLGQLEHRAFNFCQRLWCRQAPWNAHGEMRATLDAVTLSFQHGVVPLDGVRRIPRYCLADVVDEAVHQ